jgi:Asp-tRNA(Asn)/Glu-tRNA(Gln) amidotransferase A subunit family amidase
MAYELQPLKAPRLAGRRLRAFAALAERPLIGAPLRRTMLAAMRIPDFRRVPARADDAAIVVPPLPGIADPDLISEPGARKLPAPHSGGTFASAHDFTSAYERGAPTPLDVAAAFARALAASDAASPPLRAMIATNADDLIAQARESADRYAAGNTLGPLDGVPVAVKDELDQLPYPTTIGTRFTGRAPAPADATAVARLRAAGALLIGKANMHEIGLGVTGVNPHHGTSRNPYDTDRMTGGSSSGSAAAVAAGLCPIALGADAGGSIRIPAALCGVVGLKPTFGRVSECGAAPICWSLAHVGPLAATARDAALGYLTIAGVDSCDRNTHRQPAPDFRSFEGAENGSLASLRIGIYRPWYSDADPDVVAACDGVLAQFVARGATVCDVDIAEIHLVRPAHAVTIAVEMATAFAEQYRIDRRAFGLDVRLSLLLAHHLAPTDYVHAQRLRGRVGRNVARALAEVDVLVTPTTACTAPRIPADALATGEANFATLDRLMRFVTLANLTGLPAISFPAGYDAEGLPIGMQLIARPWREDVLLRFAHVAEGFVARARPATHHDLLPAGARSQRDGSSLFSGRPST